MSTPQTGEFIVEAKEHLAEVCDQLLRLERSGGDAALNVIEQMLRAVHSVKGGAAFFGLRQVEQVAHRMETALEGALDRTVPRDGHTVDVLLAATDRLATLLDDVEHGNDTDTSDVLARLDALLTSRITSETSRLHEQSAVSGEPNVIVTTAADASREGVPTLAHRFPIAVDLSACHKAGVSPIEVVQRVRQLGEVLDGSIDSPQVDLRHHPPAGPVVWRATVASDFSPDAFHERLSLPSRSAPAALAAHAPAASEPRDASAGAAIEAPRGAGGAADRSGTIRIPLELADRLMNLAGELVLVRNQSRRFADASEPLPGSLMQRFDAVTGEFQGTVLQTRMQPVGNLFSKFPRLVRDLARQLDKQIELDVTGAEVELDKAILDAISDPLTHLVRNACDHGIDRPQERIAQGKPSTGRIALAARHLGDQIRITVADDGRGIDRDALRRRAIQQGLRKADELSWLDDRELLSLILLPGFSTAAEVTDVSGRGVGMDVVKTNVAQLGGSVQIESRAGKGTTFSLHLPLTLAIIPSLLVTAAGERYAIPQKDLEELVCIDPRQTRVRVEWTKDQEMVRLRGRLLPLVRLARVLHGGEGPPNTFGAATPTPLTFAVVKAGSCRYALAVDGLLASEEIVVKPMHSRLRTLALYCGATILGDGRVALILSAEGVATVARVRFGTDAETQAPIAAKAVAEESQSVLLLRTMAGEQVAVPMSMVRRIVMFHCDQVESVAAGRYITIDGVPTRFVELGSQGAHVPNAGPIAFAVLPRNGGQAIAFIASAVLGTEQIGLDALHPLPTDRAALGAAVLQGRITPVVDLTRLPRGALANGLPAPPAASVPPTRVLLVDDTQFFRDVVGRYLAEAGYAVTTAEHGAAALALLERELFDIVVSDLEMPVMDGWTLAATVRQMETCRELPLLALTTLAGEDARQKALAHGFDAYEVKLDRELLLAAMHQLLRPRSQRIQPGAACNA